ncbi:TonB family protein [Novosphingobium barchaimii LL02]|uniref:Protein TonB n=1 Tax=Novosphingobium barchaimii LL02 TaxID=1114963 RepID=A0A0J7XSD7_9SPHN|nr:energy transducer TonB [Novosphingobium barchaimii]KMS54786.1 TonB family protein [Novosphingobium barchaimii LL02]
MATLAVPRLDEFARIPVSDVIREPAVEFAGRLWHPAGESAAMTDATAHVAYERSVYQASSRARPVAFLASAGAILAIAAAMATLNMAATHKEHARLTTVDVRDLDVTPPPPPEPTKLETPEAAITQTVAPRPMIELPAPGPVQVMVEAPPPPAPPTVTSEGVKAIAAPAVAPAPSTTMEGGDLSSKVIFAKPPTYPTEARRSHEQGTVKLLVLVGADGTVRDIQVAGSSGSQRLDRAALQAVKRWRWSPTIAGGTAMSVRGYVTIPFVLVTA